MRVTPSESPAQVAPSVLSALRQRVRFAGGEVPLWSLLMPIVLLLALGSAFVAAAISGPAPRAGSAPASSASARVPAESPPQPTRGPTPEPAPASAMALSELQALEAKRVEELSKDEALTRASLRRTRDVESVASLRGKLARDPGLFRDATALAELRKAAENPLTAPDALAAMADAPGTLGPDMLYEVWTGTVARNSATELAQALVYSKEVRAKASPELEVALAMRSAESCEQNRELLPKAIEVGDKRLLSLLAKLARRFGCGANKRQDCYACLREDRLVEEAMQAVRKRREPRPFAGK
jgi:hypothetical protein